MLSDALTNLGNYLSSQGRCFCAHHYWNQAIKIDANPVAIISKAQNYLFIANNLYDRSHIDIHYHFANLMIDQALINLGKLEEEQKNLYRKAEICMLLNNGIQKIILMMIFSF